MEKNKIKYKNSYFFIDNEKLKIQVVKEIDRSVESIKHIKITFMEEKNEK